MRDDTAERLDGLESKLDELLRRVERLELRFAPSAAPRPVSERTPAPGPARTGPPGPTGPRSTPEALLPPALVEAATAVVTLAFMPIALVASTGVLLWQRWDWLAAASFLVSAPQLGVWIADTYKEHLGRTLVVLALFWLIYVAAAIG